MILLVILKKIFKKSTNHIRRKIMKIMIIMKMKKKKTININYINHQSLSLKFLQKKISGKIKDNLKTIISLIIKSF